MQYPLYISEAASSAGPIKFRARFPEFPQVEASAATLNDVKLNAIAMVESIYDDVEQLIPAPTLSTNELQALDIDDGTGVWIFVDIDLSRVTSQSVSIDITLLKTMLQQIDATAAEQRQTRSVWLSRAAAQQLASR